ncbi:MAG: hypothetical protein K2N05_05075 [Muribaculaceae bacterium]|nr:hypothetical protein [Muribaculaceae bacterium]
MSRTSKSKRKLRSNIPLQTSGQIQQSNNTEKIEKVTKTWQLILAGCSLVGAGFAGGIYVGNNNSKIEYQDKINQYRERIIEVEKMHEKEIHDFNLEIFELKGENNELRQQVRELKTKKK